MTLTNVPVNEHRGREPYRPPVGVPLERRRWWGVPLSLLAHLFLLVVLVLPVWSGAELLVPEGAGGTGPAGGGGGGNEGRNGGASPLSPMDAGERLHYVRMAAEQPQPVEEAVPPKPTTVPELKVTPPKPVVKEPPQEIAPVAEPNPVATAPEAASVPQLAMGGTGNGDSGSAGGRGPGSGGGTGTGTGTGTGSGSGPGTGGGAGEIYPATPDFLVMPALPVPSGVRGKTIHLVFQIAANGKVIAIRFESTGDKGYDRELRERLMEYRFRPAHKADGTPVESTYVTELTL